MLTPPPFPPNHEKSDAVTFPRCAWQHPRFRLSSIRMRIQVGEVSKCPEVYLLEESSSIFIKTEAIVLKETRQDAREAQALVD